ncbi:MAG: PAS domain S-box protein [Desulfobacterales bacterium]|jgi:PAS domain S-box-containing protein
MKGVFSILLSLLTGAVVLSLFSTAQKVIAGYPLFWHGYVVPVLFGGAFGLIVGMWRLKFKKDAEKIKRLNLVLRAIRSVNQLLVKEKDRTKLLQGVCNTLVENRGYYNCWIALLDKAGRLLATTEVGLGKEFLQVAERLKHGQLIQCVQKSLNQSGVVITETPFFTCKDCPLSETYAGRSAMTVRLEHDGKVYGLLTVSLAAEFTTDEEERGLFHEIAQDIAFGLYRIDLEEEQRRMEEALRESEAKYRTIVDWTPAVIWKTDLEGNLTFISPNVEKIFGYTPEEIYEAPDQVWREKIHTDDISMVREAWQSLFRHNQRYDVEYRIMRKDGEWLWVRDTGIRINGQEDAGYAIGFAVDITDRMRAVEAIYRQIEELFAIFNAIEGPVYVADMETYEILAVNRYCEDNYGPELVGEKCYEVLQEGQEFPCSFCTNRMLVGNNGIPNPPVVWELKNTKTGNWYQCIDRAIHWPDGRLVRMEIAFNINERKEAEEALRKSLSQLEERVKELNCLFSLSNLVEKRAYSLDDILQGTVDLLPPAMQYPEMTGARITLGDQEFSTRNFMDTEWTLEFDLIVYGERSGEIIVCYLGEMPECGEGPFFEEERSLLRAVAERLGRIVERKHAEKALRESEQRFRRLVENSLTGISIIQNGQVVYQNSEQERLLGPLPRPTIFGDLKRIHPDDVEKIKKFSEDLSSNSLQTLDIDFRLVPGGQGDTISEMNWINCRTSAIEFRGKDAILANMMDVTQTKKLEHLLILQDKMASLGRVAAGIAHEIRNPLSGINIYLNTLQKLYERGEEQTETIQDIFQHVKSASAKIESVIRRVMDFSKPSEPKFVSADVNHSIEEAIRLTAVTMRKSGIRVDTALSEDLPKCRFDPQLMEEVILNLMNNAADAMKKISGEKKIQVLSSAKNNHVAIRILDSGPGIPLEYREMIFDPFYTTKPDSTGIGLSLCHRIISDHGGSIRVETGKLGGAEFIIEIPTITSGD